MNFACLIRSPSVSHQWFDSWTTVSDVSACFTIIRLPLKLAEFVKRMLRHRRCSCVWPSAGMHACMVIALSASPPTHMPTLAAAGSWLMQARDVVELLVYASSRTRAQVDEIACTCLASALA
eukprot:118544-Pleurochrysis_carterae.AAC.1